MNNNGIIARIFGGYICVACKKRFNVFGGNALKKCPYCNSGNWYQYKIYRDMLKQGYSIK